MSFRADVPNKKNLTSSEVESMLRSGPKLEWFNGPYRQGVILDVHRYALVLDYADGRLDVQGFDTEEELGWALLAQWRRSRYTDRQSGRGGYYVSYYVDPDEPLRPRLLVEQDDDLDDDEAAE